MVTFTNRANAMQSVCNYTYTKNLNKTGLFTVIALFACRKRGYTIADN